jgi:phytoene dehydrogenase-like protein
VNGKEYFSRFVVSSIDFRVTFQELIGEEHVKGFYMDRVLNKWRPTSSCFSIWLGLDRDLDYFQLKGENITYYPEFTDLISLREHFITPGGSFSNQLYAFLGLSANLDPSANPTGYSQLAIGIPVLADFENNWGLEEDGRRGKRYRETKQRVADQLITLTENLIPNLRKHIVCLETATPYTYERYSGNRGGAYLGYLLEPKLFMDRYHPDAKGVIPGLYFSSNWNSLGGGVMKVMMEGIRGADLILEEDGRKEEQYDFDNKYFFDYFE